MNTRWYLLRAGQAKADPAGPLSADRLLELVSAGGTASGDWVWPVGVDVQIPVERFVAMMGSGTLPEWLKDVSKAEALRRAAPVAELDWLDDVARSEPPRLPTEDGVPDWLEEMSRLEKVPATPEEFSPEWLEDIRQIEESLRLRPMKTRKAVEEIRPTQVEPPCRTHVAPARSTQAEQVRPTEVEIPRPTQLSPARPTQAEPPRPTQLAPARPTQAEPPRPTQLAPARPTQTEQVRRTSSPPQNLLAEPAPPAVPPSPAAPLGFDPITGQIIDPAAYQHWQKAEAQRRQEELQNQPTLSVAEVFLEAQRALQEWVDADANKPLVVGGDLETIQNCSSIQDILRRYENYGPVMRAKLLKRLVFLVNNRQKFFRAFETAV